MSLLDVKDLRTSFLLDAGEVKAVDGVSFTLERGKTLGIVGESGSGKSVTAYSILQILSHPGKIVGGSIKLHDEELVDADPSVIQKIRGNKISIIFQDPMTCLNPVYTIGNQLMEAILLHTSRNRKEARERAIEMIRQVGINDPEKRMKQYPYELSGGMRQRIMIAMALACEPDILIADEPTTALDVTIQAQILELMKKLQQELGMAIIIVTHDLGVIIQMCDEVIVMYAGRICEKGTIDQIFYEPKHEYTKGLIRSIPYGSKAVSRLIPISGSPVDILNLPKGCAFSPRCDKAMRVCLERKCDLFPLANEHYSSCWLSLREEVEAGRIAPEEAAVAEGGNADV
ncbi:MAG: ABC transporter ATP-binding protein [Candidatus Izemoplasmatales bacterium]